MIQINLLPVRARRKKQDVRQIIVLYFVYLFLILAVMGVVWVNQKNRIEELNRQVVKLEKEVQAFAGVEAKLKELQAKKEALQTKKKVIENLRKDRDVIPRMMALLSSHVPADKMWFEKLAQTGSGMTIDGIALSNEAVAEFMRNLESSPYIEKGSVSLTHSRRVSMTSVKLREFQVSYRFLPYSEVQKLSKKQ